MIEKFTSLISKKIFPMASIFILAVVVAGTEGTVMVSVPSFAVLARITVGKVLPPSVDNDILTLAQFTLPVLVPLQRRAGR